MVRKLLAAVALLIAGVALYEGWALLRARQHTPAVIEAAAKGPLPLSALTPDQMRQLLAVEDPGFFGHRGVDFSTPGQGLTTITQALVKIFYFERFEPGFAKLEQSLIARFVLDPATSKRDQLKAFINHANFGTVDGRAVTGFDAAARAYYGCSFRRLSDDQFLSLVAMLMALNALDPLRNPEANRERVERIKAMLAGRCEPAGLRDVTYESCAGIAPRGGALQAGRA